MYTIKYFIYHWYFHHRLYMLSVVYWMLILPLQFFIRLFFNISPRRNLIYRSNFTAISFKLTSFTGNVCKISLNKTHIIHLQFSRLNSHVGTVSSFRCWQY